MILDLLADGSINLTTVRVLAGVLTAENHAAILREATGKTKEEVSKIKVRFEPKPAVATTVRKLSSAEGSPAVCDVGFPAPAPQLPGLLALAPAGAATAPAGATGAPSAAARRPAVQPLAPNRYKVEFTIDDETWDRLRHVQDLMRRDIPSGDAAVIFARALVLLEQQAEKKAFSATDRPRPARGTKPGSRTTPASVERQVWARDEGRCAFVGRSGIRCSERSFLEFHHQIPHGHKGEATVDNIALRCRAHNVYEAELVFGRFDPLADRQWLPAAR